MTYPESASLQRIQELHDHAAALLASRDPRPRLALAGEARSGLVAELGAARDAIAALRREVDAERADHLEALEHFREERERTVAGITADRDALAREADRARGIAEERRATIAALEAELWTLVEELDAERSDREEVVAGLVADLERRTEDHDALAQEHRVALEAAADEHRAELEAIAARHATDREELAAELDAAQSALGELVVQRNAVRGELRDLRERAAEDAARAEGTIQQLEARVADGSRETLRLGRLHDRVVADATRARTTHERELGDAVAGHRQELATTVAAHRQELAHAVATLEDLEGQLVAARNDLAASGRALKATEAARVETARMLAVERADLEAARAALAARASELHQLEARGRASQEALVAAQREIASAHVGLASSQRALDDERLQRGALGARLSLEQGERASLEARIVQVEAAGGAALQAERGLRLEIQRDLQGKLSGLRDELSVATARLRDDLAVERTTLQERIGTLESCLAEERAGREAAEADRADQEAIRSTLEAFTERIERAGAAAEASAQRCAELEQELEKRDAMLRRVSTVAAELRAELADARAVVTEVAVAAENAAAAAATPATPDPEPEPEPAPRAAAAPPSTLEALTERLERLKLQARAAGLESSS